MNNENFLLKLQNVTTGYNGIPALENVSLTIFQNDFIGVIGPNGGGKTTLIKIMLGLIKPWRGKVLRDMRSRESSGIGYLPQINYIDKKFPISVGDVVMSGQISKNKIFGWFSAKQHDGTETMMKKMGIYEIRKKPIGELSGGQLQRVFLCRSVISSPELLILDEPNTYVDNQFESDLYESLKELNQKMAIVIVTHDIGMISSYVKTIACVNKSLHYHESNIITEEQLQAYNCPIKLITHGEVPHTVLGHHEHSQSQ